MYMFLRLFDVRSLHSSILLHYYTYFAHFLNNLLAEIIVRADVNSLLFTNDVVIGAMSILAVISFVLLFKSIIPELNSIK